RHYAGTARSEQQQFATIGVGEGRKAGDVQIHGAQSLGKGRLDARPVPGAMQQVSRGEEARMRGVKILPELHLRGRFRAQYELARAPPERVEPLTRVAAPAELELGECSTQVNV